VLTVGEETKLRLPSLSGAGYEWTVETEGDDDAVAVSELDPDVRSSQPGESPEHVFGLSAQQPGHITLRFEQRRPWENVPPRETREFKIEVTI